MMLFKKADEVLSAFWVEIGSDDFNDLSLDDAGIAKEYVLCIRYQANQIVEVIVSAFELNISPCDYIELLQRNAV